MVDRLHNLPFWLLEFDKYGAPANPGLVERFSADVTKERVTDLFILSHGWNNDRTVAIDLYNRFFGELAEILSDARFPMKRAGAQVGLAGVIWPSILWPEDAASESGHTVIGGGAAGGSAGLHGGVARAGTPTSPKQINEELKKGYTDLKQRALLDDLTQLLENESHAEAALSAFQAKLSALLDSEPSDAPPDRKHADYAEAVMGKLSNARWRELLEVMGDEAILLGIGGGGAAGLGEPFKKLWAGAKAALRVATYWQMKQRAGVVGRKGLGEVVLTQFAKSDPPKVRVHLLGHSFGARLVAFSLSGLPVTATGPSSPVKSLFLLQGAFSHYAFADSLPHDVTRSGYLKGMAKRVDGPLLTTHSLKDLAVGLSYPVASFLNQDDAAGATDQESRWAAMGHDGAQAVGAGTERLEPPGKRYPFQHGNWLNLDGNSVIIHGGLPSGSHSDVVHPHTAWAALTAAGLV